MSSNPVTQQLPPACGARQLSKLKRFLTTLMQVSPFVRSESVTECRLSPANDNKALSFHGITILQFGDDISSEVGDQVRSLILALVNSAMSTEEFHSNGSYF